MDETTRPSAEGLGDIRHKVGSVTQAATSNHPVNSRNLIALT